MKKLLLLAAASVAFSTAAHANTIGDTDESESQMSYTSSMPGDDFEDAGSTIVASFTFHGEVTKACAIQGVDSTEGPGLNADIDLGTIGIRAGDEQDVHTLFTMTGPGDVQLHSDAAGCNYRNRLSLRKGSVHGLVNHHPGSYDSNQFQANIPYVVRANFRGVATGSGAVAGTAQHVTVGRNDVAAHGNFGAWRSPLNIRVRIPQVMGKGLVGGRYDDTLTLTLSII